MAMGEIRAGNKPEKSKIVNVKRHYSEFLGFKLRVREKGKKPDGSKRYVIEAHVRDKALKKIRARSKESSVRYVAPMTPRWNTD